ncbi:MAG: hypothetical protein NC184_05225 [Roseburia sp.]|nr:hypothetical protein [Roseburia sp.]
MTLFDRNVNSGFIRSIGGDEQTHRRLVDMGLLDARFTVRSRRENALLADFGDFSAVVCESAARCIETVARL